jgi:uncharacterized repeat protein (TIGR03847 family)
MYFENLRRSMAPICHSRPLCGRNEASVDNCGVAPGIDLDPLESLAVGTVGPPGQRRFFLQARAGGRVLTLGCEKVQVQLLVERIREALEAQGILADDPPEARPSAEPVEPLEAEFDVAEVGVGFHEPSERFVIVVREGGDPEADPAALTTIRMWSSSDRLRAFTAQAGLVLAQGRQPCPRCGLPMDPAGHPCPMSNGVRPVF